MKRIAIACSVALGFLACTGAPYRLPIPADYDHAKYRELGPADGHVLGRVWGILVPFIPVNATNTTGRAIDRAIRSVGGDPSRGDVLTDVMVTERYSWSPITWSRAVFVHGIVLRKRKPGEPEEPESDYDRGRREERERLERDRGTTPPAPGGSGEAR
jgi:hypothetical protein